MIARAAESNPTCFSEIPLKDLERTLIPSYLRLARYLDNNWGLTKFCVSQFKGQRVSVKKAEITKLKQLLSRSKSFDGMNDIVGFWTGEEEFAEIVKTIEERPPLQHRLAMPEQETTTSTSASTPQGTQNPYPPGSGAPLLPSSIRTILPAMAFGHDPETPVPMPPESNSHSPLPPLI